MMFYSSSGGTRSVN